VRLAEHRPRFLIALLLAFGLFVSACGTDNGTDTTPTAGEDDTADTDEPVAVNWRYSSNVPEASAIEGGTRYILENLEERLGGQVTIEPYWAASLVPQGEDLTAVQEGTIDIGHVVQSLYAEQFPLWGIAAIPFLVQDPEAQMRAAVELYRTNEAFRSDFDAQGVRPLYFKPLSIFSIGLPEPVETIEDLRGLRIRSIGVAVTKAMTAVGIDPVDVNLTETYDAVQRGTVDGWGAIPLELAVDLSLHEVNPYVLDAGLGMYTALVNVISLDAWEALPAGLRGDWEELVHDSYDAAIQYLTEKEARACEATLEAGTQVIQLPESERERWRELVLEELLEDWRTLSRNAGHDDATIEEFENQYLELTEQYAAQSAFQSGMEGCE
jgi:TRAP-type transport system periplasmic protein